MTVLIIDKEKAHSIESERAREREKYVDTKSAYILKIKSKNEKEKSVTGERRKEERILYHSPQIDSKMRFLLTEWLSVNEFMNSKFFLLILIISYTRYYTQHTYTKMTIILLPIKYYA